KIYDRYSNTNSRNRGPGKEIGGPDRDRDRADSAGPDISRVWPERLPEFHAATEGYAAGNHDRYGCTDERRVYDGGFGRGSAHRSASTRESFRPAGARAARADYCGHSHVSHLHGAGHDRSWRHCDFDGTLSRLGVSRRVPTDASGENNFGSELK